MLISQTNTGAVLEAVREHYQARDFAAVVGLLRDVPRDELLASPEEAFMLADSARRVGGIPDVAELATRLVDVARKAGPSRLLCDALNLHGVLLLEAGKSHAAERAWFELVGVATQTDNSEYVARASNNLGVAAILSMRLDDAIVSFQRSVAAYLRLGYSRGLAQSHQNLGIVYRELDREDESHAHFQKAVTWAYAADSLDDVARAELELALLLVYSARASIPAATAHAQQALTRFTELGHPGSIAEAMRVSGVIEIAAGRMDEAEHMLNAALEGARIHRRRLLEAETLLALAAIAQPPRQWALAQQARSIFSTMDAEPWGEQVRKRMVSLVQKP